MLLSVRRLACELKRAAPLLEWRCAPETSPVTQSKRTGPVHRKLWCGRELRYAQTALVCSENVDQMRSAVQIR